MANIEKASDELVKQFDEIRDNTAIPQWIQFEVFSDCKQRKLFKINKTNDVTEVLTDGINFTVVFNEEIFDDLPEDMQSMAIVEAIAGVKVSESDAVSLEKPDFVTYTGVMKKFGDDSVIRFKESITSLFDTKKQKEEEEKATR
ncbi:MAG: hypothetical protein PF487_04930, partial [Bacteroidales bacterium]|nr:hypothetical protein [Bacteroidales bacterium]